MEYSCDEVPRIVFRQLSVGALYWHMPMGAVASEAQRICEFTPIRHYLPSLAHRLSCDCGALRREADHAAIHECRVRSSFEQEWLDLRIVPKEVTIRPFDCPCSSHRLGVPNQDLGACP